MYKRQAKLCVETMKMIEDGTAEYTPQNSAEATHTSMISKELGDVYKRQYQI